MEIAGQPFGGLNGDSTRWSCWGSLVNTGDSKFGRTIVENSVFEMILSYKLLRDVSRVRCFSKVQRHQLQAKVNNATPWNRTSAQPSGSTWVTEQVGAHILCALLMKLRNWCMHVNTKEKKMFSAFYVKEGIQMPKAKDSKGRCNLVWKRLKLCQGRFKRDSQNQ